MANDCLLTKFVGSVSDSSLMKHKELRIYINNAGSASNFLVFANANGKVVATPIVGTWNDGTTAAKTAYSPNGYIQDKGTAGAVISIDNKYNLKAIGQESGTSRINLIGDLEQLKYCTDLECIQFTKNADIPENYIPFGNFLSYQ